ncbi:LURP-one-related family protein [Candidatus Sumerlaeota bacterium]|nr:LURP-one-related family protein [Candidatus Sumerlaeota bacterium]
MRQKIWSFGDQFTIKNEQGENCYEVKGRIFTLGDQLAVNDMDGNKLAFIKQRIFSFMPNYEIYVGDELRARVEKQFTLFKSRFTVDIPGPNDYSVEGDFLGYNYQFLRGGQNIASVSKQFFAWSDTYGVDVAEGEDDLLILASTVVIDMVCHSNDDS